MVATRRTSTRLAPKTNSDSPGPSSKRRATSSKRTIALDSETESSSIVTKRHKGPSGEETLTQRGGATSSNVGSTTDFATSFVKCSASDGETESSGYSKPSVDGSVNTPPTTLSSRSSTAAAPPANARGKKAVVSQATPRNITRRNTRSSAGRTSRDSQGDADSHTDFEPEEAEPAPKKGKGKEGPAQRNRQEDSSVEEQSDSEEDEDIYVPISSSRKGKEVMRTRARGVSTVPPKSTIELADSNGSDFSDAPYSLSEVSDSDSEGGGFLVEEEEPEPENAIHVAGPSGSASRTGRQPRSRRARRTAIPKLTRAERARNELYNQHPELATIWDELEKTSKITVDKDPQPEGLSLTMLPFQLEGLHWMRCQEKTPFRGGILADEMGMGKTIQTLSLIMSQIGSKPNLVLAPTVALMQWKSEIEKYTGGALKVLVYHGSNRETSVKELAKYDVILTTYSVIESVWRKQTLGFKRKAGIFKEDSALHGVRYHRVVLDEAHNIKASRPADRACNTAKAVFALKTKFKLCLSGTPIQNRIGELFSLLRFLEADPFAYYFCRKCPCKSLHWKFSDMRQCDDCGHSPMSHLCFFNHDFLKPIINGNEREGQEAYQRLQLLLGQIMLRRTKLEKADDLGLPPKFIKVRRNYFSEAELDLYDSVYGDSKRKFDTYVAQGVILNNYANIFTLITRMRQLADHPDLVLRKHGEEGQTTPVCCLCDDEAEEAIKSRCHHIFCRLCVQEYIGGFAGEDPECPKCHITLNIDLTQPAIEVDYSFVKKNSIVNRIDMNNWRSSTKIEALVEELYNLRSDTHTIKSIVFSQFTSMLQLVEWRLKRAGFKTAMLEGSMSPAQREATINHFMEDVETTVFLVSLKAGGVALNLIEASQVYMLDPWWNPSVESQAMDRIHRIGQTRPCRVVKLIIENSIESRILELQEKKCKMIEATVGGDQKALERLTPGDMQFLFNN